MSDKLAKLNKTQAIEVANRMKNRAQTMRRNAEKLSERIVHGFVSAVAGGAFGYWMGQAETDYQEAISEYMADNPGSTAEDAAKEVVDPRKWGGIDKDLIVSGTLAALALTNVGGRKASPIIEAAAIGGLSGWAYNRGMEMAIESASDDDDDDDDA